MLQNRDCVTQGLASSDDLRGRDRNTTERDAAAAAAASLHTHSHQLCERGGTEGGREGGEAGLNKLKSRCRKSDIVFLMQACVG